MSWLLGDKNDDGGGGWNTSPAENIALSESLLDLQALRYSDLSDVTVRRCSLALSTFCVMVITNKGRDFVVQCIYLPLFFPCRKYLQLLCCVVGRSSIGHCVASQWRCVEAASASTYRRFYRILPWWCCFLWSFGNRRCSGPKFSGKCKYCCYNSSHPLYL